MNYRKIKLILNSEITILDYIILSNCMNNTSSEFESDPTFKEHFDLLKKQNLIANNNKITPEGKEFLENLETKSFAPVDYWEGLHILLQDEMIKLTGKKYYINKFA